MPDNVTKLQVLWQEISLLQSRIGEHGCGHLHTAVSVLTQRCSEIENILSTQERVVIELLGATNDRSKH